MKSRSSAPSHVLVFRVLRGQRSKHSLKIAKNYFFPFTAIQICNTFEETHIFTHYHHFIQYHYLFTCHTSSSIKQCCSSSYQIWMSFYKKQMSVMWVQKLKQKTQLHWNQYDTSSPGSAKKIARVVHTGHCLMCVIDTIQQAAMSGTKCQIQCVIFLELLFDQSHLFYANAVMADDLIATMWPM